MAIALAGNPKILFADEPTTALDVTIQAQILDLLREVQQKLSMATVFVTHDLGVVAHVADRVAVMYAGKIVETGTAEEIFYDPRHPYTWGLMRSLPALSHGKKTLPTIPGMRRRCSVFRRATPLPAATNMRWTWITRRSRPCSASRIRTTRRRGSSIRARRRSFRR